MPMRKLTELLDQNRIHYAVIRHTPAYTAARTAESRVCACASRFSPSSEA